MSKIAKQNRHYVKCNVNLSITLQHLKVGTRFFSVLWLTFGACHSIHNALTHGHLSGVPFATFATEEFRTMIRKNRIRYCTTRSKSM